MRKVEFGQELAMAVATPDGARKATETAFLLLLNALHLAEPERGQTAWLRPLGEGAVPGGALVGALNALSAEADTKRSLGPGAVVRSAPWPRNVPIRARTSLQALAMLLQSERCALAEPRPALRDQLVMGYLARGKTLRSPENLTKQRFAWRRKFTGTGIVGDPAQMRAFVGAVLLAMLGNEATAMIASASERQTVARMRALGNAVQQRLRAQMPDALLADVLAGQFDFALHSDAQVRTTLEALAKASMTPLFTQETGELAFITGDVLPPGLLSGRPSAP